MGRFEKTSFEAQLRTLIEAGRLGEAEALIADAVIASGDNVLRVALDAPLETMRIQNWPAIGTAIQMQNWRLPVSDSGWKLARVHIGLSNHTGVAMPEAEVTLGFLPRPAPADGEAAATSRDEREHMVGYAIPRLRISGLERAWEAQATRGDSDTTPEQGAAIWHRQTLAAAIILLRFHQLVARHAVSPGLPRPLEIVAKVASVTWPMEQGIYEYGTTATRLLHASTENFDHLAAEESARAFEHDLRADRLRDTRRAICELREKQEAVELWPWWKSPVKRHQFCEFVEGERALALEALSKVHGTDFHNATGEEVYRMIADARHPGLAEPALEALPADDRSDLHTLALGYARRFGGAAVRKRFAGYTLPPELSPPSEAGERT